MATIKIVKNQDFKPEIIKTIIESNEVAFTEQNSDLFNFDSVQTKPKIFNQANYASIIFDRKKLKLP